MSKGLPTRFVLVRDMIRSRAVAERRSIARRVEAQIREINRRWREEWVAPLTTTRGLHEISGVLPTARPAFDIVVSLNEALHPGRFR